VLGALIGPVFVLGIQQWFYARGMILAIIGGLIGARTFLGHWFIAVFSVSIIVWVGIHHPAQAPDKNAYYKVLHRVGTSFNSVVVGSSYGFVYRANGNARLGDLVKVRCRHQITMNDRRICFTQSSKPLSESLPPVLEERLRRTGPLLSAWLGATLFGKTTEIGFRRKQSFKQTGLLHLLVVSGSHISLVAALFFRILLAPVWFLNLLRLTPTVCWQYCYYGARIASIGFVWWYASLTGLACPAQRAAICYSLKVVGVWRQRILVGVCLQALLFPCGWFSISNAMSWAAFLLLQGSNAQSFFGMFRQATIFSLAVWILIGSFSPLGIVANVVLAPWITVLIVAGVGILMLSPGALVVGYYRSAVIATEDLLDSVSEHSGYFETEFSWSRWSGLLMLLVLLVVHLRSCKVSQKLIS
jgi:hypothetical protein